MSVDRILKRFNKTIKQLESLKSSLETKNAGYDSVIQEAEDNKKENQVEIDRAGRIANKLKEVVS